MGFLLQESVMVLIITRCRARNVNFHAVISVGFFKSVLLNLWFISHLQTMNAYGKLNVQENDSPKTIRSAFFNIIYFIIFYFLIGE